MRALTFPIRLEFKVSTLSNDFTAYDDEGNIIAYVRQKLFKWKDEIQVFADESRREVIYRIKADRWLDFSASYSFTDGYGDYLGRIARHGMKSIWRASYQIMDHHDLPLYTLQEENPWVKLMDGLFGEIPLAGNYVFNPTYLFTDVNGDLTARLRKEPSLFGRRFTVYDKVPISPDHGEIIMLGLMMMVLLERKRG